MRNSALTALLFLLTACDRKPASPVPDPDVAAPPIDEVAAADSYGAEGDSITDVAFWSHPSVAFESLLIAAGAAGVSAYEIETGDAAFEIPGAVANIEVFYSGVGAGAQGYLLSAGDGAYRLHAIFQDGKGSSPVVMANAARPADIYCAGGGAAPKIYEAAAGKLAARTITIVGNGAELGDARAISEIGDIIGCHVDPLSEDVIVAGRDGAIRRIDPKTGAVFGIALPKDAAPSASGLAVGRDEGGVAQGQVALLDSKSGVVSFFDSKDGHALGAVRVKATFDLDAVEAASRIAIGSANYGGVYRDGALAVITSGAGAPVRLVPWNGVMGALSLPVAAAIDPRAPEGPAAEEGVISIDLIEP